MLMKEMKMTQTDGKILCTWVGRINIIKMTILPKAIHRFNAISITNGIFHRTRMKKNLKNQYGNTEDPRQPKLSRERKMNLEESGSPTSDYTTKLQSCYWHKNRITDQWNRTENPEINSHNLRFTKEARIYNGEKVSSISGSGKIGHAKE